MGGGSARRTVETLHSRAETPKGPTVSAPLIPATSWLRGLDLNQRPLGYEGKFGLHTDQGDPTGTKYDGDLRADRAVSCWSVSVG